MGQFLAIETVTCLTPFLASEMYLKIHFRAAFLISFCFQESLIAELLATNKSQTCKFLNIFKII